MTAAEAAQIRHQFDHCPPCLVAYDIELKVHGALAAQCSEAAPADLRLRIVATLERIDLSHLDVTDL